MLGHVVTSYPVSFTAKDGSSVNGFRTIVTYNDYSGNIRYAEIWTHSQLEKNSSVRVVRRKSDGKMFAFLLNEEYVDG